MRKLEIVLGVVLFAVALTTLQGAYLLLFGSLSTLGLQTEWLQGTPFETFVWPAIILSGVVGGTHLAASSMLWLKSPWALEATATAGFGLLIWIFAELYWIPHSNWLQVVYFALGIATLIAVLFLLKFKHRSI